ncbi:A-agglutinin anchorage subunit [Nilaparvata lugens]|uniref:A-agglutinin anchorage subunit n=1 Tax=Nilaparvata lugens TaxID=108931 RepID=UPI00193D0B35|nr:A-agglutinin anchorage subunit [Nilaparvata lugens]XP_039284949.1 A-agglutinin anchorage subunit [Nilaparvata lugens]
MLASGLAVEGGGGAHGGHALHFAPHLHPHHAFSAPPVPEFLRPLPKPAPLVPQAFHKRAAASKFDSPVNLASKEVINEDDYATMFSSRFFPPPPPHHLSHYSSLQGPYGTLYPGHYTPMLPRDRPGLPPPTSTPLSPLEAFPHSSTPDSPASTFSPPHKVLSSLSSSSSTLSSSSLSSLTTTPLLSSSTLSSSSVKERKFKVPSGKEGSLKHRILTPTTSAIGKHLKRKHAASTGAEVPASFSRGSLIQLANGELRRVEDMRTEDFVSSAERSPALRLDPSTVIRIDPAKEANLITLSYGEHRTQVEIESAAEHPYFVFNRGWASCDPDRTLATYGLKCHRLQVGDVCISLSPRPQNSPPTSAHTTAHVTAHTTAHTTAHATAHTTAQLTATAAQLEAISALSASSSCKKRRWSAPDQLDAILGGGGGAVPPPTPPTSTSAASSLSAHRKGKD